MPNVWLRVKTSAVTSNGDFFVMVMCPKKCTNTVWDMKNKDSCSTQEDMKPKCSSLCFPWRSFMDSKILVSRGVTHSFGCGVLKSQRTCGKICRQQVEEYTQKRHKRKISAEKIDPYILDAGWQQEKHTESGFKVTKIHISSCSEKAVQWPPLQQRKHEERKQFSFQ